MAITIAYLYHKYMEVFVYVVFKFVNNKIVLTI